MKRKLINSQLSNYLTYQKYMRKMTTLAENVFQYEGLPDYIDVSYLNKVLLRQGAIAFFKDEVMGVLALPFTNLGTLDVYGRPTKIQVHGANGYINNLENDEFVIMYDNNGRYPLILDIKQDAERMANAVRTMDINVQQQRTPRFWKTSKDREKTVRDLANEVDGMVEKVIVYDDINVDDTTLILEPAPYVTDKITDYKEKIWAEFLTYIGISNLQLTKKERHITDEIQAMQGGTIASRFSRYEPRLSAINKINKKFGLDIKLSFYDGMPSTEKDALDISDDVNDEEGEFDDI